MRRADADERRLRVGGKRDHLLKVGKISKKKSGGLERIDSVRALAIH